MDRDQHHAWGFVIRDAVASDREGWMELWREYCAFYHVDVSGEVTRGTWERILDEAGPIGCLVARGEDGSFLGFCNYVLHPHTWSMRTVCYLEDMFVASGARGRGIATAMIKELEARGRAKNWFRIYWITNGDNATALSLYDRVARRTDFVRFEIALD